MLSARSLRRILKSARRHQNSSGPDFGFADEDFENGGSDRLVDAICAWGDEKTLWDRVQAHYDAGADHVCIQPFQTDGAPGPDLRVLEAFAPANQ